MRPIRGLLVLLVVCILAGAIGGTATGSSIQTWYASQRKPELTPPGWVFAPVWTVLYAMMAVAAWLDWRRARGTPIGRRAMALFSVQLGLNALWSILFFGLRLPGIALVDIGLLWASIVGWLAVSARIDHRAAWLIAPYLAWVTFASYLNLRIWQLNR
jgi:benzodiazapine receptor